MKLFKLLPYDDEDKILRRLRAAKLNVVLVKEILPNFPSRRLPLTIKTFEMKLKEAIEASEFDDVDSCIVITSYQGWKTYLQGEYPCAVIALRSPSEYLKYLERRGHDVSTLSESRLNKEVNSIMKEMKVDPSVKTITMSAESDQAEEIIKYCNLISFKGFYSSVS